MYHFEIGDSVVVVIAVPVVDFEVVKPPQALAYLLGLCFSVRKWYILAANHRRTFAANCWYDYVR